MISNLKIIPLVRQEHLESLLIANCAAINKEKSDILFNLTDRNYGGINKI